MSNTFHESVLAVIAKLPEAARSLPWQQESFSTKNPAGGEDLQGFRLKLPKDSLTIEDALALENGSEEDLLNSIVDYWNKKFAANSRQNLLNANEDPDEKAMVKTAKGMVGHKKFAKLPESERFAAALKFVRETLSE